MEVKGFVENARPQLGVLLGRAFTPVHAVELKIAVLNETQTEPNWRPSGSEAPLTVEVSAVAVQGSYVLSLPLGAVPVDPHLVLGGDWIDLTDTWQSDTPEEEQRSALGGVHAGLGVKAAAAFGVWVAARGAYRTLAGEGSRPRGALGLGPWILTGAVGIRF